MSTVFSQQRMDDSKRAHLAARAQFYPLLFPGRALKFEDVTKTVQDLEYAIDVQVAIDLPQLRAPLRLSIQERWRLDLAARSYGDVTVTEWNLDTDEPSELHKLGAHLFVYGFYDKEVDVIPAAVAIEVPRMLRAISLGKLSYTRRRRGDQSFVCFTLCDLEAIGAVILKTSVLPMPRFQTDDKFDSDPAVLRAGTAAMGLYYRCGIYVAGQLLDGFVPSEIAAQYGTPEWVKRLTDAVLWEPVQGGYYMPLYFAHGNKTREKVLAEREAASGRQQRWLENRNKSRSSQRRISNASHNASHDASRDGVRDTTLPLSLRDSSGGAPPRGAPSRRADSRTVADAMALPPGHRPASDQARRAAAESARRNLANGRPP